MKAKKVKRLMSDNEFMEIAGMDHDHIHAILDELQRTEISDLTTKFSYVKNNKYGHHYMYYALTELSDVLKHGKIDHNSQFTFSQEAISGLLNAFLYSVEYMQEGLPQSVYNYTSERSHPFFNELINQYQANGAIV